MTLDDHIETVKQLREYYLLQVKALAPGQPRANADSHAKGLHWAENLKRVLDYLMAQKRLSAPIPKSLGDVSDLPPELLKELSVVETDDLEEQILTVMRACPEDANLDQVLVGLYRKFKVVQTRRFIQNKLYRMSRKELIHAVAGHRATYSLKPQPPVVPAKAAPKSSADLDDEIPF